jgi:hypothetical protein
MTKKTRNRKEVRTVMILPTPEKLVQANEEHVARLRREIHPPVHPQHVPTVRKWVGRQMVRWGTRLAADPSLRPVRLP